jgi:TFIIH basal transcription factor complex TTD-A subunit
LTGLLIECDPSIKAMILKYDEERHDYIVEDLDDENHLVIKESQLENLKVRLDQVSLESFAVQQLLFTHWTGP